MKPLNLTYRYALASFLTVALVSVYQFYYNYQINRITDEALISHNDTIKGYVSFNNRLIVENSGLKHDLIHSQAMHKSYENQCHILEEQIDVISNYWKNEYLKIQDELFDLKHNTNSNKRVENFNDNDELAE